MSERLDRFGAVASSLCAAHCAVCAFLPVAFSALGLGFLIGHEAEWFFTGFAIAFALGALILGWRQHRSVRVAIVLGLGVVGLLASRGLEMGSGHHGHHGEDSHHARMEQSDSHGEAVAHAPAEHRGEHADEHEGSHAADDDVVHLLGAAVGILAGLLLLFGHILNIRAARQVRPQCCT